MNQPSTALAQVTETPALPSTRVSRYAQSAKAENTRKAYRIDWDDYLLWCDLNGRQPMPATVETVVEYLESLADAGAKVATLRRRLSSISVAHQMRGYQERNPAKAAPVPWPGSIPPATPATHCARAWPPRPRRVVRWSAPSCAKAAGRPERWSIATSATGPSGRSTRPRT